MAQSRTATEEALRALAPREMSAAELEGRLSTRGYDETERAEAIVTLRRAGLLDDRRFAESRAGVLARRGAGNALIRHELERAGVSAEVVAETLEELEPESERARRVVERRGPGPRTFRYLASKGFSEDAAAIARGSDGALG